MMEVDVDVFAQIHISLRGEMHIQLPTAQKSSVALITIPPTTSYQMERRAQIL
jgi:hypothetical protein